MIGNPVPNDTTDLQSRFGHWALGQINSNIKRALLAEFIVSNALELTAPFHNQWEDYDLMFRGVPIEVKSSGNITPPFPTPYKNTNPRFDIAARTQFWSYESNKRVSYPTPVRPAHCYIFCLHTAEEERQFRPFDVLQWEFCVCKTEGIDAAFSLQKSATWSRLLTVGESANFGTLKLSLANVLRIEP